MRIEKVELLVTLKAGKKWRKGSIFNSNDGPIPQDILKEVKAGAKTVKVLKPNGVAEKSPIAAPETENEKTEVVETPEIFAFRAPKSHDLPQGFVDENLKEIEDFVNENPSVEKVERPRPWPEPPPKESSPPLIPDLEELIKFKGSVAETVRVLGVSYPTVVRWRKGESKPQDKMLKLIKKKLRELKNDQSRDDSTSSAGSEGAVNKSEL